MGIIVLRRLLHAARSIPRAARAAPRRPAEGPATQASGRAAARTGRERVAPRVHGRSAAASVDRLLPNGLRRASSSSRTSAFQRRSSSTAAITIGPWLRHEDLGFLEDRIGGFGVGGALADRVEPLASEPGDAAVLVPCSLDQPAQRLRRMDALGGRNPRRCEFGRECDVHQHVFVANVSESRMRRRSSSCVRSATCARIASAHSGAASTVRATPSSEVAASAVLSEAAMAATTRGSASARKAAASAARSSQRVAAAIRTSGEGSAPSSCASTSESGGSAATPATRCVGSACSCSREPKKILSSTSASGCESPGQSSVSGAAVWMVPRTQGPRFPRHYCACAALRSAPAFRVVSSFRREGSQLNRRGT